MTIVRTLGVASVLVLVAACGGESSEDAPPQAPTSTPASETPPPAEPAPAAAATDTPAAASASAAPAETPAPPKTVSVDFIAKSGSKLTGTATLSEQSDGVKVVLEVAGIKPGEHGTHVHETPDCSAPDAKSAGGHYNPDHHDHALPTTAERHLGDLGNITVGKDGKGKLEIVIPNANLKADDPHSFIGRSIIVHEKHDDGGQPVGNAGGRIGCAEIKG